MNGTVADPIENMATCARFPWTGGTQEGAPRVRARRPRPPCPILMSSQQTLSTKKCLEQDGGNSTAVSQQLTHGSDALVGALPNDQLACRLDKRLKHLTSDASEVSDPDNHAPNLLPSCAFPRHRWSARSTSAARTAPAPPCRQPCTAIVEMRLRADVTDTKEGYYPTDLACSATPWWRSRSRCRSSAACRARRASQSLSIAGKTATTTQVSRGQHKPECKYRFAAPWTASAALSFGAWD